MHLSGHGVVEFGYFYFEWFEKLYNLKDLHNCYIFFKFHNFKWFPARLSFKIEGEILSFSDEKKLKEFVNTKPVR